MRQDLTEMTRLWLRRTRKVSPENLITSRHKRRHKYREKPDARLLRASHTQNPTTTRRAPPGNWRSYISWRSSHPGHSSSQILDSLFGFFRSYVLPLCYSLARHSTSAGRWSFREHAVIAISTKDRLLIASNWCEILQAPRTARVMSRVLARRLRLGRSLSFDRLGDFPGSRFCERLASRCRRPRSRCLRFWLWVPIFQERDSASSVMGSLVDTWA